MHFAQYQIRPIRPEDLKDVCEIAQHMDAGFISLFHDLDFIRAKIQRSVDSFALKNASIERLFLFVLVDLEQHKVVGTAAIEVERNHGMPFYCYQVDAFEQQNDALKIREAHTVIIADQYPSHASLFCTLYLHPEQHGLGQGSFLSRIRCLFLAEFGSLFPGSLMGAMRGYSDKERSPFWEAVGRHFFGMDFEEASKLCITQGDQIFSGLFPTQPIYIDLLSPDILPVIGKVHEKTQPALHILEKEGFKWGHYIDMYDGGPLIEAQISMLKTVQESKIYQIQGVKPRIVDPAVYMICNRQMDFRVVLAGFELYDVHKIYVEAWVLQNLNIEVGDSVRVCRFK